MKLGPNAFKNELMLDPKWALSFLKALRKTYIELIKIFFILIRKEEERRK